MSILNRYILKELLYYFGIIIGIFTVILVAKEINDIRDDVLDLQPPVVVVLEYIVMNIPTTLAEGVPLIALFAVLFGVGLMSKNREILAMVSTGISFRHLAVPILIFGGLNTLGGLALSQYIVPYCKGRASYIYKVEIKGDNKIAFFSNDDIFRKGAGNRFYVMSNFDGLSKVMTRPSILDVDEQGRGLKQRIEAKRARLVVSPDGKDNYWEFEGASRWLFSPEGGVKVERFGKANPLRIKMEEKLDSFLSKEKSPDEMSISELGEYSATLARQGARAQLPRYETNYQCKMALPFSCLLLSVIAFAIASDVQLRRFVMVFTQGLGFGIAYYVVHETAKSSGSSGALTGFFGPFGPAIGAWSAVVLFSAIAAYYLRRLSVVH